jgi:NTE family protein
MNNQKKTALVLGGGGARGAYQAAVAKEIFKKEEPEAITGISAGALNGSILSQKKPNKLLNIWRNVRKQNVWSGGHGLIRYFRIAIGNKLGLYDPDPLHKLIKRNFDPNNVQISFKAGAVSLQTGRYVPFEINPTKFYSKEKVKKARRFVVASSAIPGAVEPVAVTKNLEKMADGGIRNMAPVGDALEYNPSRVIVILNTRMDENVLDPEPGPTHIFGVGRGALQVLLNETLASDVRTAQNINEVVRSANGDVKGFREIDLHVIEPSENLGSSLDFSEKAVQKRIAIGQEDGKAFFE